MLNQGNFTLPTELLGQIAANCPNFVLNFYHAHT